MGDIQRLKNEIDTDPLGLGYSTMSDLEVSQSLMAKNRLVNKGQITGDQLGDSIDATEYAALSDADKSAVRELWQVPSLNPFGFASIVITSIFPGGGDTITTLAALRRESISRAKEVGVARRVGEGMVAMARAI